MADVALRPTFPQAELDRQKLERLTNIIQARDDPASIDQLGYARVLYGMSHRYGTALAGTAQSIQGFTVEDVRAFYRAAYQPSNSAIIAVGDVTPARLMPMLEASFGKWQGVAAPPHATLIAPATPAERTIYIINKPGAPQSQVRIGWVGVPRATPDYFPITVMNTVLGGAFSSRLNLNLREKHGYTYGASSQFDMRLGAGPFVAAAGIRPTKPRRPQRFFIELNDILKPVPADEVAPHYVSLRYPLGFETTGDIASAPRAGARVPPAG